MQYCTIHLSTYTLYLIPSYKATPVVLACRLDRLQHEVPLPSREHQAQPLQPVFPKLHRAPVVQVGGRLIARHLLHLPQKIQRRSPKRPPRLETQRDETVRLGERAVAAGDPELGL
eukprot:COSAG05_NODE_3996_length_1729_cov_1.693252_3_plen_116_part_00